MNTKYLILCFFSVCFVSALSSEANAKTIKNTTPVNPNTTGLYVKDADGDGVPNILDRDANGNSIYDDTEVNWEAYEEYIKNNDEDLEDFFDRNEKIVVELLQNYLEKWQNLDGQSANDLLEQLEQKIEPVETIDDLGEDDFADMRETDKDKDKDGRIDSQDPDDDNDGISDNDDPDANGNGMRDVFENFNNKLLKLLRQRYQTINSIYS